MIYVIAYIVILVSALAGYILGAILTVARIYDDEQTRFENEIMEVINGNKAQNSSAYTRRTLIEINRCRAFWSNTTDDQKTIR